MSNIEDRKNQIGLYVKENNIKSLEQTLFSLSLSLTRICNRQCYFCPSYKTKEASQIKYMEIDVVLTLIEQIKNKFRGNICIGGFGEPTLHKNFTEIIRLLHNKLNCDIRINTNNYDFNKLKSLEDLDKLTIEISDYGDNIVEEQKNNLSNNIIVKSVNNDKIKYFYNRAGSIIFDTYIKDVEYRPCYIPFYKLEVDTDGSLLMGAGCDWKRKCILGNIFSNDDVYDVWLNNSILNETRKNMIKNRRLDCKLCGKCNCNGMCVGEDFFNYWKNYYDNNQK